MNATSPAFSVRRLLMLLVPVLAIAGLGAGAMSP